MDGVVGHGDDQGAQSRAEDPHSFVGGAVVLLARLLKGIGAVVAGQCPGQADQHLAQGWMDVEEEGAVDVPAGHLPEVGFVPAEIGGGVRKDRRTVAMYSPDMVGFSDLVEAGHTGQQDDEPKDDPLAEREKRVRGRVFSLCRV